jgi:BMFP domain-containing protein YqiC
MQKDSKLFDDFAKLASGAAGTFLDLKREIEAVVMDKMEKLMGRMQLVKREEFEVVRLMVEQARVEQEKMVKKIAQLEKLLESQGSQDKHPAKHSKK